MQNSTKNTIIIAILAGLVGVALAVSLLREPSNNDLTLSFSADVDGALLVYNQSIYPNPGGEGLLKIRDFRFYISHIELVGKDATWIETDSYHLARFDNEAGLYTIELQDIPIQTLEKVKLSIGVDEASNTSIKSKGDLDPNSQMAWNWTMGYKFVLLEGTLDQAGEISPIVFHVGFSENLRAYEFDFAEPVDLSQPNDVSFLVNPMNLFDGTTRIDLSELSSVKFDRNDARMIADNYQHMVTLKSD